MNADDLLAWLAARPKRERPVPVRSDTKILQAWLALRSDAEFRSDLLDRHNLGAYSVRNMQMCPDLDHAIENAWGMIVQAAGPVADETPDARTLIPPKPGKRIRLTAENHGLGHEYID